jgi:hypothetical protein
MIMDGGYLGEVSRVIGGAGWLKARCTHSLTRKHILEENRHRSHASAVTGALGPLVTASALLAFGLIPASRTSAQSVSPPPVTILQDSGSLADGFIFLGPQAIRAPNPDQGAEIIDNQGRIVWFLPTPGNEAMDFRVQTYQGNPVLTWSQGITFGDAKAGDTAYYIADSTYKVIAKVQAGNGLNGDLHEFRLTPQNTALITIYNHVPADLSSLGGRANGTVTEGVVQEIDVATGKVLLEWHSLPNVALSESYAAVPAPSSGIPYDYFHLNSVNPDSDGNLLISSRFTCTVFKLNRTTGAIMWRLGGKKSDFALGPGLPFAFQHDAIAVDSKTIRIFDNQSDGNAVLPHSRVIWVSHDDTAMTASVVRSVEHPGGLSAGAEGGAQGLGNGDTITDWGITGRFSEFNSAGQLLFDASEPKGYCSYRAYRSPWVGNPSTSPTAVALVNSDGSVAVHAIWNGPTEVASWEVLGGAAPGSLSPVGSAAWNGLDTVITVPGPLNDVQVVAMNSAGSAIGTSAAAAGPFAAVFPAQPASQTIAAGGTVAFSALATGSAQTYQWLFNGSPLSDGASGGATVSGATGPTLVVSGATGASAGSYSCVAASFGNSATSDAAALTVAPAADAGRLSNTSCRSAVGTGHAALIVGFAVGGRGTSGSLPLLIRASGPALAKLGVAGSLPDPKLQLYAPGVVVASNSGWAGNPAIASEAAAVGAFPWAVAPSLDSALYENLAAGPFSAVISGAGGDTGVALGEVYDAMPAFTRLSATPRIVNISGRALVGTGGNILIAGFVIGGAASETVLIRGSGPALSGFGVSGALADPLLRLYQSNGDGTSTLLGSNAGWNGDAQVGAAAASVGAFSWGDLASADSALLITLPPGAYTAEVSGAGGDTGVALVEVYEVP